jgi:protoporphyrinogen oxidase
MKAAIVGTGMLGLALGYYLQKRGHQVCFYEKSDYLGGLACPHDYGPFVWDRFYHVILPSDLHLIALLEDLELDPHLVWTTTRTGLYSKGRFYSLSNALEMIRFPLLNTFDKVRMGAGILYGLKQAESESLYSVSSKDWLIRYFGRRNYEYFWKPLLNAKFGVYADSVAAVYIWSTIRRLFGARSAASSKESMGYVSGGYSRILGRLRQVMEGRGAAFHLGVSITRIAGRRDELAPSERQVGADVNPVGTDTAASRSGGGCWIQTKGSTGPAAEHFDHVVFTAPEAAARSLLAPSVRDAREPVGGSQTYLGVICVVLVLRQPLTPFYILNIADERVALTGLLEMTNLIDRARETKGLSLVYLPRYLGSDDPRFEWDDGKVLEDFFSEGFNRLFPDVGSNSIVTRAVHRARFVQPLPLVGDPPPQLHRPLPKITSPFQIVNTGLLHCPTLNVSEVVGLAKSIAEAA